MGKVVRYPKVWEIKLIEGSCVRTLLKILSAQLLPFSRTDRDASSDHNRGCQE